MRLRHLLVLFTGALFLQGCSTASYQKQVSDLSSNLTKMRSTVEMLVSDERQAFVSTQVQGGLAGGAIIQIPSQCGITPSNDPKGDLSKVDCRPQLREPNSSSIREIAFNTAAPNTLKLVAGIDEYGKSLVVLAEAKDIAELKEAVAKTGTAISGLAATAGVVAAPIAAAVTSSIGWVIGKYLDWRRLEELKNAVSSADTVVETAANLLADQTSLLQRNIVNGWALRLQRQQTAVARMQVSPTTDRFQLLIASEKLLEGSLAVQQLAKTDSASTFKKMRDTHAALLKVLQNPEISPEDIFKQIGEFRDQIDSLRSAFEASTGGK